ncbi:hypothetical protein DYD21_00280 [Rhodohalobacter sp. SW132]|uniref:S9 family peptidase n=1 Tax=Rhodohalobacter sp. SW132 TaxID=2293433 RepID=UPI000E24FB12|nr:prolyl oligopeptidase family serine peptidase [Rhodohalobacter sp. SW132]REL38427.1 hypothetical protein DYD21_00280 [Rhodohalobacter sp. SW132]
MTLRYSFFSFLILLFSLQLSAPNTAVSQNGPDFSDGYLTPAESISDEVLAPRHENVTLSNLSPSGEWFLNTVQSGLSPLSSLAKPHHNLAGLQVDPRASRHRSFNTRTPTVGLELIDARNGESRTISTPGNATITNASWSPDGERLAYFAHYENATFIYVAEMESGQSTLLTNRPVLATSVTSFQWSGDGNSIFAVFVPEGRSSAPSAPQTSNALQVRTTSPGENRLRTYQSLLKDRHEADLLEHFVTGQLAKVGVNRRSINLIGEPVMFRSFDASPDGNHVIVQKTEKPFSYIVPASLFGWTEEIWDLNGTTLTELRKSDLRVGNPDADEFEDFGRRNIQWRPDGNGLSLLLKPEDEKNDEEPEENGEDEEENGDSDSKPADRVMQWLPPFGDDDLSVVYPADREMSSVSYSDDAEILFITERRSGNEKLYAVYTEQPDSTYTIYDYDRDDFYENPGNLMEETGSMGVRVVKLSSDENHVYLRGTEYFEDYEEQAPRPFVDRVTITEEETERIFQSSEDQFERMLAALDDDLNEMIVERQSSEILPDSWLYSRETEEYTKLTDNQDYNEAVTQTYRERIKLKRADGYEFWMEVVMPNDWNGSPLPGLIWHYPREFNDQESYNEGLRTYNKNSYPRIGARTADIMVKEGYAVLKPDWPIVGERGTSNDSFVWSIVQNSTVVIDSAAARGYIDRDRMAIGGHSYGAFGASNAMIHTSFFKAGIAGAGNYNRTLTPMGFQRERSDLWRGADRYMQMSPIFWADRIDGALLMYHGEKDQNVGTWPTNSNRMFHALNGLGKDAALYMYPHEGHGPSAEETLLDMWTRWVDWLDFYLKEDGYQRSYTDE